MKIRYVLYRPKPFVRHTELDFGSQLESYSDPEEAW